jgi:CheY-like chemotaxis protein
MRPIADERGIGLVAHWPPGTPGQYIRADRRRLGQILLNLVSNAVKYNIQGGSVTIRCDAAADGMLRVSVRDTGPGIAAEKLPLLFTPFERLGAEQLDVQGTGLGLAVSRSLAEAMGGRLRVGETSGPGSTFELELPAGSSPVRSAAPGSDRGDGPWPTDPGPTGTVLYIEDSAPNVTLVKAILRLRPNVELISATAAAEGFELARERSPDLILLDMHLPDASGDVVLQWLLRDPRTAAVPVVFTSADASPRQVERLIAAGAADYVTKPIDVKWLLGLVDRLLTPA